MKSNSVFLLIAGVVSIFLAGCSKDNDKASLQLEVISEKSYTDGTAFGLYLQSMSLMDDESIALAGWSTGSIGAGGISEQDVFVVKTHPTLEQNWAKSFGGSKADLVRTVIKSGNGSSVFAASSKSTDGDVPKNQGAEDLWFVKLDEQGDIVWNFTYGGSGSDIVNNHCIVQKASGGYVAIGATESSDGDVTEHVSGYDLWLLELDSDGKLIHQKSIGTAGDDYPYSIIRDHGTGYVVLCKVQTVSDYFTSSGIWVFGLDSDLNPTWKTHFDDLNAGTVLATADGGYIVLNSQQAASLVVHKLGATGAAQWNQNFPASLYLQVFPDDIIEFSSGGFLALGTADDTQNVGSFILERIDGAGNKMYQKIIGSTDIDGQALALKNDETVLIGGSDTNFLLKQAAEK